MKQEIDSKMAIGIIAAVVIIALIAVYFFVNKTSTPDIPQGTSGEKGTRGKLPSAPQPGGG